MTVDGDSLTPPALSCVQCDKQSITKWADGKKLLEKIKAVCYFVYLFVCLFVILFICFFICLSICLSVCLFVLLCT